MANQKAILSSVAEQDALLTSLLALAREASQMLLGFYNSPDMLEVEKKGDQSPVTNADRALNHFLVEGLTRLTPDIPVISEEGVNLSADQLQRFWLVDPLDGTKSFIRRSGEFTINIGLVEQKLPIFGILAVPVAGDIYYTGKGGNAYKNGKAITARPVPKEGISVVASQAHRSHKTDTFIKEMQVHKMIAASSAIKFGWLAEGKADLYPRFGATMEWDTAAGHAILNAAGGRLTNPDGSPFLYAKPGFLNGDFIAQGKL